MNIVHIISSLELEASGPTYSVTRLCDSLIEKDQPVLLTSLGMKTLNHNQKSWLKIFPRANLFYKLGISFAMYKWLFELSKKNSITLLHNHGLWMMPNIYPGYISGKFKIPLIISPRGTLSKYAMSSGSRLKVLFWYFFQKKVLNHAKCFHATCYSEYLDIRRLGFRQPVAIIPNGIDIPIIKTSITNKRTRTLLFLGRIHPIKGLELLLRSWSQLQSYFPNWELRIVGPDNRGYLNQMRSLSSKLNLQRIIFAGPAYGQDKINEFNSADLFVLPTYSENFGISVAEALASGVPVIVSKGAPWEGIDTNNCGWWIDIGVESLVKSLIEAMNKSPAELRRMGANGRDWMQREFSWSTVTDNMLKTYEWTINGGKIPKCIILN